MGDDVFVVSNQLGQYWTRAGEWVDGREPQRVMKHRHRDEAVNQLVELSAKDIELRGHVLQCTVEDRGEPQLEVSAHRTPTQAERAALAAARAQAEEGELAAVAGATPEASGDSGQDSAEPAASEAV